VRGAGGRTRRARPVGSGQMGDAELAVAHASGQVRLDQESARACRRGWIGRSRGVVWDLAVARLGHGGDRRLRRLVGDLGKCWQRSGRGRRNVPDVPRSDTLREGESECNGAFLAGGDDTSAVYGFPETTVEAMPRTERIARAITRLGR